MQKVKKERIEYIDAMKGFAIILVVFYHVAAHLFLLELIPDMQWLLRGIIAVLVRFHMPLFFMLSGITFSMAISADVPSLVFACAIVNVFVGKRENGNRWGTIEGRSPYYWL